MTAQVQLSSVPDLDAGWRPIDPNDLPATWPDYRKWVVKALDRETQPGGGCYNERDVFCALLTGAWQLWANSDERPHTWEKQAIAITEIMYFPRQRKCVVRYAAGNMEGILEGLPVLEAHAKAAGCQRIEVYGRKGWERVLSWRHRYAVLEKDLV